MSIVTTHDFYPDGNVRTDPQQLSERQKEQARQNIGAAAKNEIVGGGLTPEQVKKLAKIDDKLDKSQLQTAINQALLQAQQSGLFDGQDGQTPKLSIGTVTTLEPGAKVTASITGPTENLKLNLGIPRGQDGGAGKAGGYYTPKVTESAPGEYQITFEPSAPDMPAVGPAQLTLPSGNDGGHYTPIVSQPDAGHLKFDFTGSLPGMPPIDPVTVELPKASGGSGGGLKYEPIELAAPPQNAYPASVINIPKAFKYGKLVVVMLTVRAANPDDHRWTTVCTGLPQPDSNFGERLKSELSRYGAGPLRIRIAGTELQFAGGEKGTERDGDPYDCQYIYFAEE